MFDPETLKRDMNDRKAWEQNFRERYKKSFKQATRSGIPIDTVYSPSDIKDFDIKKCPLPGNYPYARGIYPAQYQFQAWMNQQVHGYGQAEDTRERMDKLVKKGMEGYFGNLVFNLVLDLVSQAGLDPDDPEAHGKVGQVGVHISCMKDMEILFDGLPLEKVNASFIVGEPSICLLAMYIVYSENQGVPKEHLRGNTMNYLLRGFNWDVAMYPPKNALKISVELIRYCSRFMPQWNTTNLSGYIIREAGASAIQELAFTIAKGMNIIDACIEAGLKPDDFVPRFGFQLSFHNDFFEDIAKYRALRRMWATINRHRYGCRKPKSLQARIHTHTCGSSLVAQQPMNNIVRAALQTLGAVLAGTNALQTSAYDEALSIPTEAAATLALRTQQIIQHESGVTKVTDPLAGSYYLEWLTEEMEKKAYEILDKIEAIGGFIRAYENGWLREQIADEAAKWRRRMDSGEEVVVGLNRFCEEGEKVKVPLFRVDEQIEKRAIKRIKAYRKDRDQTRCQAALSRLREVAEKVEQGSRKDYLLDALIEAYRARATLGETMSILKETFGYGFVY
ncbi:MAG: methylmalonyl-CoA mutase family protein [Desulfobacteraceae bacterium]|jgi:methylmalonyl-CoA mutase N-terminal domain/subunit